MYVFSFNVKRNANGKRFDIVKDDADRCFVSVCNLPFKQVFALPNNVYVFHKYQKQASKPIIILLIYKQYTSNTLDLSTFIYRQCALEKQVERDSVNLSHCCEILRNIQFIYNFIQSKLGVIP